MNLEHEAEQNPSVWNGENYGGEEYDRLESFPPKILLDYTLANHMIETCREQMQLETDTQIKVAELFAGRAPISRILKDNDELNFECDAFDKNADMQGTTPLEWINNYNTDFDATNPTIEESIKGQYDLIVIENGLYATSISPDGTEVYTKHEAEILRMIALQKAMSMLKPGGFLFISDALNDTSNFGLKRIKTFIQKDVEARRVLRKDEKGAAAVVWEYLVKEPLGHNKATMLDVLKRNKEFIAKAQLFTHEENLDLFRRLGLNERILFSNANDYLGSNGTYILRKVADIETQNSLYTKLGEAISLKYPIHKDLLKIIGEFRRQVYAETKATENLPIIDKYDRKSAGMTLVYPDQNHIGLAAVATLQPRDQGIGLDAEDLMVPKGNQNFYEALKNFLYENNPKVKTAIDNNLEVTFAEVRRLAANNLSYTDTGLFVGDLWQRFTSYSRKHHLNIILFVSDEKRLKLFNHINKNNDSKFKKVEGFDLDRDNEELQTMMICASNYFFGEWENLLKEEILTEQDINNIRMLKSKIVNGDSWRRTASQLDNPEEMIASAEKLLRDAPSNVNLYYTDYPMPNLD